ncbi:hypothetical protein PHYSODRAFT_525700, partial [Phytophthora sojae]
LMVASQHVHWMAALIPVANEVLIDLSAPFGWSGSPPFYGAFGRAITWLVQQNSPSTVHAMLAILGPRAINEENFSHWETRLNALGLTWDTVNRTVSIPGTKIKKALERVRTVKQSKTVTKSDMMKLLGSLRHICSCLRTTRPFYQRLQSACNRAPRHGVYKLAAGAKADLVWFDHILAVGHLQELPLSIFSTRDPKAHVHLYMDASNVGLVILNPSVNEFIQIPYDSEELEWIHSEPKCGIVPRASGDRPTPGCAIPRKVYPSGWYRVYPTQESTGKPAQDERRHQTSRPRRVRTSP